MRKLPENQERIFKVSICCNCRNASTCMYLRNCSQPILRCEEYEEFPRMSGKKPAESNVSMAKGNPSNEPEAETRYLGLCANCKHKDSCTFPRPAGGVWHCEEYE